MIIEIVKSNLNKIENDLHEIKGIEAIDFIDIFPKSEEHKRNLDEEAMKLGKLIEKTERGNIYFLNPLASEVYLNEINNKK